MTRPGRLLVRWSKRENDFRIAYPSKPDGHLMYGLVSQDIVYVDMGHGKGLVQELEERGYDITTLRIQCDRKVP
jgi:hypothetical protein